VEGFARQWGEDYCAELTLTFAENITEKAEASRRFNSLRTALAPLVFVRLLAAGSVKCVVHGISTFLLLWLILYAISRTQGSISKGCETSFAERLRMSTKTASW
jgi:hypothetical protein